MTLTCHMSTHLPHNTRVQADASNAYTCTHVAAIPHLFAFVDNVESYLVDFSQRYEVDDHVAPGRLARMPRRVRIRLRHIKGGMSNVIDLFFRGPTSACKAKRESGRHVLTCFASILNSSQSSVPDPSGSSCSMSTFTVSSVFGIWSW